MESAPAGGAQRALGLGRPLRRLAGPVGPAPARADLTERPGNSLDDPIDKPHDLSGLSVKTPRVRIVHTTDPAKAGGSMYLQQVDPWLGYQWGRDLIQREFRERDGVYGDAGKLDGPLLPDGASHMMCRSHVNSCGICHNTPYRDGGAGATIPKNGGEGRNTPAHVRRRPGRNDRPADAPRRRWPSPTPTATGGSASKRPRASGAC